jgi:hypothetical protein
MGGGGHVARMRYMRSVCRILVGKSKAMRSFARPIRRCEDNIKMDLGEIGCDGVDWSHVAQGRGRWTALVNTVMNLRVT